MTKINASNLPEVNFVISSRCLRLLQKPGHHHPVQLEECAIARLLRVRKTLRGGV